MNGPPPGIFWQPGMPWPPAMPRQDPQFAQHTGPRQMYQQQPFASGAQLPVAIGHVDNLYHQSQPNIQQGGQSTFCVGSQPNFPQGLHQPTPIRGFQPNLPNNRQFGFSGGAAIPPVQPTQSQFVFGAGGLEPGFNFKAPLPQFPRHIPSGNLSIAPGAVRINRQDAASPDPLNFLFHHPHGGDQFDEAGPAYKGGPKSGYRGDPFDGPPSRFLGRRAGIPMPGEVMDARGEPVIAIPGVGRTIQNPPVQHTPTQTQKANPLVAVLRKEGYSIGSKLGSGSFGVCYAAQDTRSRTAVAVKVSMPSEPDYLAGKFGDEAKVLIAEADFLAEVKGQRGCLQIRDIFEVPSLEVAILITERADGDLNKFIDRLKIPSTGALEFRWIYNIFRDLIRALVFLVEDRALAHRDIHPGNIFFKHEAGSTRFLLADFGLAGRIGTKDRRSGAPFYMPPELLDEQPPTPTSDLYSLALIVFLLDGSMPVPKNLDDGPDIGESNYEVKSKDWARFAPCLNTLPEDRPPVTEVREVVESMSGQLQPRTQVQTIGHGRGRERERVRDWRLDAVRRM